MDRTEPSDHILIALPDFRVVDADSIIVSDPQRAAGGHTIEFGFQVPLGVPEKTYVCILAVLRKPVRPQISLPEGFKL